MCIILKSAKESIHKGINEEFEKFVKERGVHKNGYRKIKSKTIFGDIGIDMPRTRGSKSDGNIFYSDIKGKDISELVDKAVVQVLGLMKMGNTFSDIKSYFNECYDFKFSNDQLSGIYNSVSEEIIKWRSQTLQSFYSIMYLDATFIKLKVKNPETKITSIKSVPVYFFIGIDLEGKKEILDFSIMEDPENAKCWQYLINNIKNRGVTDVLFACMDGLNGLKEAFSSNFPNTITQPCIVHKIRNIRKHISYKDHNNFMSDFKSVYNASNIEDAELQLNKMKDKWSRYAVLLEKWLYDMDEWANYFGYSYKIRRLIYTTNIIENWNGLIKSTISKRKVYFNHKSAEISIFLAFLHKKDSLKNIVGANELKLELINLFGDRIPQN